MPLQANLEWFVNDALMVLFFFVVGMEIRRELHDGALSSPRRAALPVAAAIGGMLAPACVYLAVVDGPAAVRGWGVPVATDIAFAVGILSLLGSRVPPALRIPLLALAVTDDLGAIVVIAVAYSSGLSCGALGVTALDLGGIRLFQRLGVRRPALYVLPGLVAWAGTCASGVHPTLAGVVIGLMTPVVASSGEARSPAAALVGGL